MIYEPLFRFNFTTEKWENVLATGVTTVEARDRNARMAVAVDLKPGVKWHDGSAFESSDVLFTYEFMRKVGGNRRQRDAMNALFADVRVESPSRIVFEFATKIADARAELTDWIIPAKRFGKDLAPISRELDLNRSPMGTGPYRFESFASGSPVLAVNQTYHMARGKLDLVWGREFTDVMTETESLLCRSAESNRQGAAKPGGINLIVEVPPEALPGIEGSGPGCQIRQMESYNVSAIALRQKPGSLLLQERVRRAMTMAINRRQILKNWYAGYGNILASPVVPSAPFHDPSVMPIEFDAARAKEEIQATGATGTHLKYIYPRGAFGMDTRTQDVVKSIKDALEAAGLRIDVQVLDINQFEQTLYQTGDFDMAWVRWEFNPAYDITPLFHSREMGPGGLNYMNYSNVQVDGLLSEYQSEGDPSRRRNLMQQLQQRLSTAAPAIFLVNEEKSYAYHSNYRIPPDAVDSFFFFTYVRSWWRQ
jgi:peptide/nickel transport system substrate-binding protein